MAKSDVLLTIVAEGKNIKIVQGQVEKLAKSTTKAGKTSENLGKSAGTADRNLKGAAKASANATKNFSKMSQGIGGTLVPAYATLAANVFAVSAAFNFFRRQADLAILEKSQLSFAQSTGIAMKTVARDVQLASGSMLTFRQASEAAAIGLAKGFSPDQLNELAEGARKVSSALGRDFEDSFNRLLRGVSKAEPELLDELGITLRLKNATEQYSAALGKNVDQLTEFERSQAVLLEVQRQLNQQFGSQELQSNPFIKLSVTFDKLVKDISQKFLPIVSSLAEVLNRSAGAAIAAFGLFGLSILKAIVPFGKFNEKIDEWSAGQREAYDDAKNRVESYKKKISEATLSVEQLVKREDERRKKIAGGIVDRGSESPILKRIKDGEKLRASDEANLRKAFKSAERQYEENGKITTGIFKGQAIRRVKLLKESLEKKNNLTISWRQKTANQFKLVGLGFQKFTAGIKLRWSQTMTGLAKTASVAGAAINKAVSIIGFIGTITLLVEAFKQLQANAFNFLTAIVKGIEAIVNKTLSLIRVPLASLLRGLGDIQKVIGEFADYVAQTFISLAQKVLIALNSSGLFDLNETLIELEQAKIGFDLDNNLQNSLQNLGDALFENTEYAIDLQSALEGDGLLGTFANWTMVLQSNTQATLAAEEANKQFADSLSTVKEDLEAIQGGFSFEDTGVERTLRELQAYQSLPLARLLEDAVKLGKTSDVLELLGNTSLPLVSRALEEAGDDVGSLIQKLQELQETSSEAISFNASLDNSIVALKEALLSPDLFNLATALENADVAAQAVVRTFGELEGQENAFEKLNEAVQGGDFVALKNRIDGLIESQQKLALSRIALQEATDKSVMAGTLLSQEINRQIQAESALLDVRQKQLEIENLLIAIEEAKLNPALEAQKKLELERARAELTRLENLQRQKEEQISDLGRLTATFRDNFQTGMASAFDSVIQGTMSIKDAFANMATNILKSLSKVIAEMLTIRILQAAISGLSTSASTSNAILDQSQNFNTALLPAPAPPSVRMGGVVSNGKTVPSYSSGGVASGSTSGYPAILHGTEAVVPLPNGRSIPVEMMGGSSQQNNVTVNVAIDNQGNATTDTSQQGPNIGNIIAQAVQKELQNQKRAGGILSPYGVA